MKKILGLLLGAACWVNVLAVYATEKFEILPDLPEPLSAAQASSVSTTTQEAVSDNITQSVGQEPSLISVVFSLLIVILLIYATGIIYAKLNKVGLKAMKKHAGGSDDSRISVISTTPLGSNKSLHIVELDGKRMLLGASSNSIDLIKDLGSYPPREIEEGEYSKIEIPNIRIPKIEIPKIEFPNIGFTRASKKSKPEEKSQEKEQTNNKSFNNVKEYDDDFIITDIYEESSDGIIDKLFVPNKEQQAGSNSTMPEEQNTQKNTHSVDPEEYALYKKYL